MSKQPDVEKETRELIEFVVDRIAKTTDDILKYRSPDFPDLGIFPENDPQSRGESSGVEAVEGPVVLEDGKEFQSRQNYEGEGGKELEEIVCLTTTEIKNDDDDDDDDVKGELMTHGDGQNALLHVDMKIKRFFNLTFLDEDDVAEEEDGEDEEGERSPESALTLKSSAATSRSPSNVETPSEETIVLIGDSRSNSLAYDDEFCDLTLAKLEAVNIPLSEVPGTLISNKRTDTPFPLVMKLAPLTSLEQQSMEIFSRGKGTPIDEVPDVSKKISSTNNVTATKTVHERSTLTEDDISQELLSLKSDIPGEPHKQPSEELVTTESKSRLKKFRKGFRNCPRLRRRTKKKKKSKAVDVAPKIEEKTGDNVKNAAPRLKLKAFRFFKRQKSTRRGKEINLPEKTCNVELSETLLKKKSKKGISKFFSIFAKRKRPNSTDGNGDDPTNGKHQPSSDDKQGGDNRSLKDVGSGEDTKVVHGSLDLVPGHSGTTMNLKRTFPLEDKSHESLNNYDDFVDAAEFPRCNFANVFASLMDGHASADSACLSFVLPISKNETYPRVNTFLPMSAAPAEFICNPLDILYSGLATCPGMNPFLTPFSQLSNVDINSDQQPLHPQQQMDYIIIDGFPLQSLSMHCTTTDDLGGDYMPLGVSKNAKNSESLEDLDEKFVSNLPVVESACQTLPENLRNELTSLKEELEMLKNKKKVNTLRDLFAKLRNSTSFSSSQNAIKKPKNNANESIINSVAFERNQRKCKCEKCEKIQNAPAREHLMEFNDPNCQKKEHEVLTKVSSSFTKKLSKLFSKVVDSVEKIKPEREFGRETSKKALKLFKERQKLIEKIEINSMKQQKLLQNQQEFFSNQSVKNVKKKSFAKNNRVWPSRVIGRTKVPPEPCKVALKFPFLEDPLSAVLLVPEKVNQPSGNQSKLPPDQTKTLSRNYFSGLQGQASEQLQNCLKAPNEMLFPKDLRTPIDSNMEEVFMNQKNKKRICLMKDRSESRNSPESQSVKKTDKNEIYKAIDEAVKSFLANKTETPKEVTVAKENMAKRKGKKHRARPAKSKTDKNGIRVHNISSLVSGPFRVSQPGQPGMEQFDAFCDNHYCLKNPHPTGNSSLTEHCCKRRRANKKHFIDRNQAEAFSAPSHFSVSSESIRSLDSRIHSLMHDEKFRPFSTPAWTKCDKKPYQLPPNFLKQIKFPPSILRNQGSWECGHHGSTDEWSDDDLSRCRMKHQKNPHQCCCCHKSKKRCRLPSFIQNLDSGQKNLIRPYEMHSSSGTSGFGKADDQNEYIWFQEFPPNCKQERLGSPKRDKGSSRSRMLHKLSGHFTGQIKPSLPGNLKKPSNFRNNQLKRSRFYFQPKKQNIPYEKAPCGQHCNCQEQRGRCPQACNCQNAQCRHVSDRQS